MNCFKIFQVLVLAFLILACSRGNALETQVKKVEPSIERALWIDGMLVQPLDIIEWEGKEWILLESFDYIARRYSYSLANLNSEERVLLSDLNQVESPIKFSKLVLGIKEIVFFGGVDGKVVKYAYDSLGVVKSEPVLELSAKETIQGLYFYENKLYVVLSRLGIHRLAIIDVSERKISAVDLGGHKFSRIWDFSVQGGSLVVLGELAFLDDPLSKLRYFELDLSSARMLQYRIPRLKDEAILSARIIGRDKIGIIFTALRYSIPRVYKKKDKELSFALIYEDETQVIQNVVLFSACGEIGQVSMVMSKGIQSNPFVKIGQVRHDLYPKIENQMLYRRLFVLEEGERAKIGVEFDEVIEYTATRGVAVYNVDDSFCSRVKK